MSLQTASNTHRLCRTTTVSMAMTVAVIWLICTVIHKGDYTERLTYSDTPVLCDSRVRLLYACTHTHQLTGISFNQKMKPNYTRSVTKN